MAHRNIVVIGGSAGAAPVLRHALASLPREFPASVFPMTHLQKTGANLLYDLLRDACAMPVEIAVDGRPIHESCICLPAGDRHLILTPSVLRLGSGPKENMARPSIDPLFRSAALAFGPRVIGVLLSGYLDDGVSGLRAIRARGGRVLVQHPLDAEVPQMPQAALDVVEPDRIVRRDDLAGALVDLVEEWVPDGRPPPDAALELEVRIAGGGRLGAAALTEIAQPSALTCPTCQGVLSEVKGEGPLRYRCQTGHAFTAESALEAQQEGVDEALLLALRVMEERVTLVSRMTEDARRKGHEVLAELYESRRVEYEGYARTLREAAVRSLMRPAAAAE